MNLIFPCIAECSNNFRLSRYAILLCIFDLSALSRRLPIRIELNAIWRVHIDALDLSAQRLAFCQTRHHEERVTEDHSVLPVALIVVIALGRVLFPTFRQSIEVVKE